MTRDTVYDTYDHIAEIFKELLPDKQLGDKVDSYGFYDTLAEIFVNNDAMTLEFEGTSYLPDGEFTVKELKEGICSWVKSWLGEISKLGDIDLDDDENDDLGDEIRYLKRYKDLGGRFMI